MNAVASKTNYSVNFGLLAGLIVCIILLLQYLGGIDMYLSPVGSLIYVLMITMAIIAGLKQRRTDGFLEFKDALKITFGVFALAMLLHTLFTFILFNYIDIPFKQAVSQEVMDKTEQMMKKFGMNDSKIDEAMEIERNSDQFAFGRVMMGYAISCIVAFIICLIISVSIKKPKPAFDNL